MKMQPATPRPTGGFTLMELVVVLAVITLLTGIAIPTIGITLRMADTEATTAEMLSIRDAILNFYDDTGRFPDALADLTTDPGDAAPWQGPYITAGLAGGAPDDVTNDAWGHAYQVITDSSSRRTVRSWGENGISNNGTGDDIDLAVDVTPARRRVTRERMDTINAAILAYNRYLRLTQGPGDPPAVLDTPLQGPWATVLARLKGTSLLPNTAEYDTDAWGNAFVCGPDPVQYVTSSGP